jgi:prepilin peptidase CpaA
LPASSLVQLAAAGLVSLVLVVAAVSDIRYRRIPNWTVLAVIGLFAAWAVATGGVGVLSALEAAGLALVVSIVLYTLKIMGAGDSKLFTAVALFAGMGYLPLLVVATTLAGGAVALVSLASRPRRAMAMFTLRGKGDWGRGVPYGVAIAVGGAVIMWGPIAGVAPPFAKPSQHVTASDIRREFSAPEPKAVKPPKPSPAATKP